MPRTGSILVDFLKDGLFKEKYVNLKWINRCENIFGLTCTHRSSKEWSRKCFLIFEDWENIKPRKNHLKQRFSDSRQRLLAAMKKSQFLKYYPRESGSCLKVFKFLLAEGTNPCDVIKVQSQLNLSFSSDSGIESPPFSPYFGTDEGSLSTPNNTILSSLSNGIELGSVEYGDLDSPESVLEEILDMEEFKSFLNIDETETEFVQDMQTLPMENMENLPNANNCKMSLSQSHVSPSVQNISDEVMPKRDINTNEVVTFGQVSENEPLMLQVGDYTIIIIKNTQ